MVLFVSDMHFQAEGSRAAEMALVACIRANQASLSHLILGGDVFDAYIEYRSLIPKGCVRLMGCLAELADAGIQISYILGNHDCWHKDYFAAELGILLCPDALQMDWNGGQVNAEHGDAVRGTSTLRRFAKAILRHPVPGALYRTLIPGDWGMRLAHQVKRGLDARSESPQTAAILRNYARNLLESGPADLVLLGHSHKPEFHLWPQGAYINAGSWRDGCHYVVLTDKRMQLMQWEGTQGQVLKSAPWPPPEQGPSV
ncbi:MAG: UDP-2,3-diacylglucosamine diphosphatase [Bacteroidota bacterium]|nr:UDP-2,3-diacylglucosamine diphosphatase [Bacteroidota bacterium]